LGPLKTDGLLGHGAIQFDQREIDAADHILNRIKLGIRVCNDLLHADKVSSLQTV
jgi:hypothetical protein